MKKTSGCLCESKNVKGITSSEPRKESIDQKQNATGMIPEANKKALGSASKSNPTTLRFKGEEHELRTGAPCDLRLVA
jgi:hypothetical protein